MIPSKTIGPFTTGVNNRTRDFDVPSGAVRDAVNVDLSLSGKASLRQGQAMLKSTTRGNSLWSNGDRMFYADGSQLIECFDNGTTATRFSGLTNHTVAYADWGPRGIVFTDMSTIHRLDGTTVRPIALATPNSVPIVTVNAGAGALPAGLYQLAVSFQNSQGEESALTWPTQVSVSANASLTVSLPPPAEVDSVSTMVYMSACNGDMLYLAEIVSSMVSTLSIAVPSNNSRPPLIQHAVPLPPGDIVATWKGRLFSHANGVVFYTQPYSGLCNPAKDYLAFNAPVTIMFATDAGLWIVADQTYFLEAIGERLQLVAPLDAVPGTLAPMDDILEAAWMTQQGLVMTDGNQLTFLQQDDIAVSTSPRGAAIYRQNDGRKQIISSQQNPSLSTGGANAWFAATILSEEVKDGLEF